MDGVLGIRRAACVQNATRPKNAKNAKKAVTKMPQPCVRNATVARMPQLRKIVSVTNLSYVARMHHSDIRATDSLFKRLRVNERLQHCVAQNDCEKTKIRNYQQFD